MCQMEKNLSEFCKNRLSPDGLNWRCRDCVKADNRRFMDNLTEEQIKKRRASELRRQAKRVRSDKKPIRHYSANGVLERKGCARCKKILPISSFAPEKTTQDGLKWSCIECTSQMSKDNYRRKLAEKSGYYEKLTEQSFRSRIKRQFGITVEEYELLLRLRGGGCHICGRKDADSSGRKLCVDHCHKTGKVRGLLCKACNQAIGQFKDDPDRIFSAAEYLRSSDA